MVDSMKPALEFFGRHESFLISTHVNPDGDGLGAVMALKWSLLQLGKKVEIVIDSDPPETFDYFEQYEWVTAYSTVDKNLAPYDAVVLVDAPFPARMGDVQKLIAENTELLVVDHHPVEHEHGTVRYIDETASSSAEMVYRLLIELGTPPDRACADYLYTGIVIDTGRFRFSNTGTETLKVAAELLAAGAEPHTISERLFYHKTIETTMALGRFINSIELHVQGRVATAYFDLDFIKSDDWQKVDYEGFVNHPLAVVGVEVAVMMREFEAGVTRISLRAKHDFNVNHLANVFGGGGHSKAAGCTIKAPLAEAKKQILEEIARQIA